MSADARGTRRRWLGGPLGVLACAALAIAVLAAAGAFGALFLAVRGYTANTHFLVSNGHTVPIHDVRLLACRGQEVQRVLAAIPEIAPGQTVSIEFERTPWFVLDVAFRGPDGPERRAGLMYLDSDEGGDRRIHLAPAEEQR